MTTLFEKIIDGTVPGRFVWSDPECVVFSTIQPVESGHMLVVPRKPIDNWSDLPPSLLEHLFRVAQIVAKAQEEAFSVPRSAVVIAGFEVPHTHIHVIPASDESAALLTRARPADDTSLDEAAYSLRDTLRTQGYSDHVPFELGSPAVG